MKARIFCMVLLCAVALSTLGIAEGSPAYNLLVSDQDIRLIEGLMEVRVYEINPENLKRLGVTPAFSLSEPTNPIKVMLKPGWYEFAVTVTFIEGEITYFRLKVVDGERTLVDLTRVEIPEEFHTEAPQTR